MNIEDWVKKKIIFNVTEHVAAYHFSTNTSLRFANTQTYTYIQTNAWFHGRYRRQKQIDLRFQA